MLNYGFLSFLISISGLMTIIFLAFTLVFVCNKYPYRKAIIAFLISLLILIISLICYSRAGYAILE